MTYIYFVDGSHIAIEGELKDSILDASEIWIKVRDVNGKTVICNVNNISFIESD